MRRLLCIASLLLFPVLALALDAPANFTAVLTDETIKTDWDAVDGAAKYSVEIVAEYDTDGDGEADLSEDFDFSTGDRTDELLPSDSSLDIPFGELVLDVDGDGDLDTPVAAMARVKALNPGKGNGRQNNPFSAVADIYPAE